jgi:P-type Cu2+ transporter
MSTAALCSQCALPVGRLGQQREVGGSSHWFCCYGCCLAFQVRHGERDEPQAAAALIRLGVGAFFAMNIMLLSLLLYVHAFGATEAWIIDGVDVVLWVLATPLTLLLGGPFFGGAWRALRDRRPNADVLVSLGVLAAYSWSAMQVLRGGRQVYFDTETMVLLLFTLGRYLDAQVRARAARSLAPLLAARRATVRVSVGGIESVRSVLDVRAGDLVRVLPGERIAVDGIVVAGRSECEESIISGQPEPQPKEAGSLVHAGSLNGNGQLTLRAAADGRETRWIRISELVRAALVTKSGAGALVDRVAAAFVPAVLLLAAASAWYWSAHDLGRAVLAALAVLVVACPCSLGLACPLAYGLAIGEAARRGILIRGCMVLEQLARLRGVAFDKTGTLTAPQLRISKIVVDQAGEAEVLRYASALAGGSDHPVAKALLGLAHNPTGSSLAREIRALPGAGLVGELDGTGCALGTSALMGTLGWPVPSGLHDHPAGRATHVFVGWSGRVHGLIALSAAPAPDAAGVIKALTRRGLKTLLLSGDREAAVAATAVRVGIPRWHAAAPPEDKALLLRAWAAQTGPVAMVGDGLNDAPVLAEAAVGIAVGTATDLAKESADVILPGAGVQSLPWLFQLARDVRRTVCTNLAWALAYNAIALSLAAVGLLQPVLAASLMAGSSLMVVVRSMRARHRASPADRHYAAAPEAEASALEATPL